MSYWMSWWRNWKNPQATVDTAKRIWKPDACFGKGVAEITDPSTQDFARTYILAA